MFGAVEQSTSTTTTIEGKGGLRRAEGTAESSITGLVRRPESLQDSTQATTVFVGVSSHQRPGAVGQALAVPREDALHFQIRGKSHGKVRWTVAAPRMSTTVVADAEAGRRGLDSRRRVGRPFPKCHGAVSECDQGPSCFDDCHGLAGSGPAAGKKLHPRKHVAGQWRFYPHADYGWRKRADGREPRAGEDIHLAAFRRLRSGDGHGANKRAARCRKRRETPTVGLGPGAPMAAPIPMDVLDRSGKVLRTLPI